MKSRKILIILIVCFIFFNLISSEVYAESNYIKDVDIGAKSYCVYEANTGEILFQKNKDLQLPIASVTKIVTAIVSIKKCQDFDEEICVSDLSIGIEGTSIYLKHGEKISIRNLLFGLILASGNDCAVALSEYFGGEKFFVSEMNNYVQSLGLVNTHFINPHGLDESGHYSSAKDLCVIMSDALKEPVFREIIGTKTVVINKTNVYQERYLKNKDKLLFTDENCIGGKTGFTDNAGRCFINVDEKNNMDIVTVVLNCPDMFNDVRTLNNLALENYQMIEFLKPYQYIDEIEIKDGNIQFVGISVIDGFQKVIKIDEISKYEVVYNYPKALEAPVKDKQIVGNVEIKYNGEKIFDTPILAIASADSLDYKYMLDNIIEKWYTNQ